MTSFARLPSDDRATLITEAAGQLDIQPVIVEKDFWVCWTLARVFATPELAPHVVFKGGTSLSKVFGAISRFSEDIDLSIAPARLGQPEQWLDAAPSRSQRDKRVTALNAACAKHVEHVVKPALRTAIAATLDDSLRGDDWLTFSFDAGTSSAILQFAYPSALPQPGGYVRKFIKLEFGSLTDQRPTGVHSIQPLLSQVIPAVYDDFTTTVTALEIERTFWEKATILHAEFHRPKAKPVPDRFARHYADFASLWRHSTRAAALARMDLLDDVICHKRRFFASSWAHYESARPGTLRLSPAGDRVDELRADHEKMTPMFIGGAPDFDDVLADLAAAESLINSVHRP